VIRSRMTIPEAKRGGKLVRVPVRDGVMVQMYEDDARARGLWPPPSKRKARRPVANKKRDPVADKSAQSPANKAAEPVKDEEGGDGEEESRG